MDHSVGLTLIPKALTDLSIYTVHLDMMQKLSFIALSVFWQPASFFSLCQALSLAGLGSGLTEAVVVNPFEVVKVSLQANRDSFNVVRGNSDSSVLR